MSCPGTHPGNRIWPQGSAIKGNGHIALGPRRAKANDCHTAGLEGTAGADARQHGRGTQSATLGSGWFVFASDVPLSSRTTSRVEGEYTRHGPKKSTENNDGLHEFFPAPR